MYEIYQDKISDSEKIRVTKLEILDEVEEWILLSRHYCITWATFSSSVENSSNFLEESINSW